MICALPDVKMRSTFEQCVMVEERLSKALAEHCPIVVEVTVYCEWPLAFWQQPFSESALPKVRKPPRRAIDSDLAELHQHLRIEQGCMRVERQYNLAELTHLI